MHVRLQLVAQYNNVGGASKDPDRTITEACAISTRCSPSFLRVGHVDLFRCEGGGSRRRSHARRHATSTSSDNCHNVHAPVTVRLLTPCVFLPPCCGTRGLFLLVVRPKKNASRRARAKGGSAASRAEAMLQLRQIVAHAITREYPHLLPPPAAASPSPGVLENPSEGLTGPMVLAFLSESAERIAGLTANWIRVGFSQVRACDELVLERSHFAVVGIECWLW